MKKSNIYACAKCGAQCTARYATGGGLGTWHCPKHGKVKVQRHSFDPGSEDKRQAFEKRQTQ